MELIDISLPLSPGGITYPKNPEVEFESLPTQSNVITKITFGSHSGTHIDAPSHAMIENGAPIDQISLKTFHGEARVIDLTHVEGQIETDDLKQENIQTGDRVLLKTTNSARWKEGEFFEDFVSLSSAGAEYLSSKQVLLVGIDSLSIKQKGNPDNTPHTYLLTKGIPILEGLDLSKAEAGTYTLMAFPLRFIGIDGSPVRAMLSL